MKTKSHLARRMASPFTSAALIACFALARFSAAAPESNAPGSIQFSSATYSATETAGTLTVAVSRTGGDLGEVSVDYNTADGSASSGVDYGSANGTLTWAAGDTADKTFEVAIFDDSTYEGDENFSVELSGETGGSSLGSPSSATVTITDDDLPPTYQIDDVTSTEGDFGQTAFSFTVAKVGESELETSVDYQTSDGSATEADGDYQGGNGTLIFGPNDTTQTLFIPVNGDQKFESDETFTVQLVSNPGAHGSVGTNATGTILNDDAAPTFSIDSVTQEEGDSGTTDFVFTVTKNGETDSNATVNYTTVDDSATVADGDYGFRNGSLVFGPEETTQTITVNVNGDGAVEADELFFVQLSESLSSLDARSPLSFGAGTGTILNDDNAPVADDTSTSTKENQPVTITLSASDANGDNLSFSIVGFPFDGSLGAISSPNCAFGSCTATVDYTPSNGFDGSDSFTYQANDGFNDSNVATVSITVNPHLAPIVRNTNDSGVDSLRQALADAADGDTIEFQIPTSDPGYSAGVWTITLNSGELVVDHDVVVNGLGANTLIVRRDSNAPAFRIFHIIANGAPARVPVTEVAGPSGVTIQGLTISGGRAEGSFPNQSTGGGILNEHAILTVHRCTLSGNSAGFGGGIFNNGANAAPAVLALTDSTLSGNSVTASGGGIFNYGQSGDASLTVSNTTLSGNSANFAGAIANEGSSGIGSVVVTSATLSGNSAPNGGGIRNFAGTVTLGNSILKAGSAGVNLTGDVAITSLGYNLSDDNGGGFLTATGDQINTDPILGPLKNNGGPTRTHAPLSNSPAIDRGKDLDATTQDQRGSVRPQIYDPFIAPPSGGDRSDIGSVELAVAPLPTSAVSRKVHGGAGTFDINLSLTGPVAIECRSGGAAGEFQLLIAFPAPISFTGAAVTGGTGTVASATLGASSTEGVGVTVVTVNLTGVTNAQRLTVALFGVSNGVNSGDVGVRVGLLLGDVNGSGAVDSSDISQVKWNSGQALDLTNFTSDVISPNGAINSSDIAQVKAQSGSSLPPAPTSPQF